MMRYRLIASVILFILACIGTVKAQDLVQPKLDCPWGSGIFSSVYGQRTERPKTEYQLEFLSENAQSGPVRFSKYEDEKLLWVADGSFGCSNGASVCSFMMTSNAETDNLIDLPFEQFVASSGENYIVIPAFSQTAYLSQGLKISSSNNWIPEIENLETAPNIYILHACKETKIWRMLSNLETPEAAEGGYCILENSDITFSYFRNNFEDKNRKGFVMVLLKNKELSDVKKRIVRIDDLKPEVIDIANDNGDFGEFNSMIYDTKFFQSMSEGNHLIIEDFDRDKIVVGLAGARKQVVDFMQCAAQADMQ